MVERRSGGLPSLTVESERERFGPVHAAFIAGDLEALLESLPVCAEFPNGPMPQAIGTCLEYAIYHSPIGFIGQLLHLGADPNPPDHGGFPPLIAALASGQSGAGVVARVDALDLLSLLLDHGADPNQRGVNDYTPLHMAVSVGDGAAVELLLARGADPLLRTRIDECETAAELALRVGKEDLAFIIYAHRGEA
ncbi:MAG: ankyrin repeat domain-containing protein [Chloroflexota bacterium]